MTLHELARESAISVGGSSIWSVLQDRFSEARRFAQANASRNHSFINAFAEMLAYFRHNLLTEVCPAIEHGHDNTSELKALIRA